MYIESAPDFENELFKFNIFLEKFRRDYVPDKPIDYKGYFNALNTVADLVYVNNYLSNEIVFTRGFDTYLGHEEPVCDVFELHKLIHPEDIGEVLLLSSAVIETLKIFAPTPVDDVIFVLDYRMRKGNGDYVRILRQSSCLESSEELGLISHVSLCTDITNLKLHGPVNWRFEGSRQRMFKDLLEKKRATLPQKLGSSSLSIREQEILHLISQGMRSQDIAEKIHVSVHTVNTHRRNMLKKLEVNTMAELMIKVLV